MLRRIGVWALVGASVAFLWFLYFTWHAWGAYHGGGGFDFSATTEAMVNLTAPVRPLFGRAHAISWYWSIVLNATMYACAGFTVELIRLTVRTSAARLRH